MFNRSMKTTKQQQESGVKRKDTSWNWITVNPWVGNLKGNESPVTLPCCLRFCFCFAVQSVSRCPIDSQLKESGFMYYVLNFTLLTPAKKPSGKIIAAQAVCHITCGLWLSTIYVCQCLWGWVYSPVCGCLGLWAQWWWSSGCSLSLLLKPLSWTKTSRGTTSEEQRPRRNLCQLTFSFTNKINVMTHAAFTEPVECRSAQRV